MPKCLYQYAVVAATALLALAQPANAQNSFADKLEARACAEALTKGKRIMAAPAAMQRRAGQGMDVRYQRLRLAPDMNQLYIEGSVFTRFRMLAADTSVTFDLDATLFADSAHYHGRRVPVVHTDNTIQVRLGRAVPAFAEDSVEVFYHGSPPQGSGFGAYTQAYHGPANSPTVWTLSEPYGAREWWPCKQDLADKIEELDVYIRTPRGFKTASNGLLVDTVAGPDGLPVYHWHHSYPIPAYLVAFATANYAEYTKRFALRQDSLLYQNYIYPEGIADWYYNLDNLVDVLRIYDRIYGPYPFKREKYGHAQFMWSGGMEHTTMSFVVSAELSLIGHELAHQWFGDNVTCGSWRDIWLNEGFASYSEALMYENLGDTADYHAFIRGTQSYVLSNGAGSVFCTDTTNVDRIFSSRLTYGKGAMLLHMLRYKLGDSAFFTALRAYQADPLLQYGFARTADLQAHLEAASGQSLTAFFNQWYYGQGYPRYQVNAVQRVADSIAITLYQTTTHPSVPFYAMPVPIRLLYANGDTAWLRLEHTASGQRFSIPTGGYVTRVDFDPESWLLAQHTVYQTLAAKPALQRGAIALHPQPASGSITVTGLPAQGATYTLSDGTGRTLATGYTAGTVALPATTPPGVYLLRLAVGAEAVVLKCILE